MRKSVKAFHWMGLHDDVNSVCIQTVDVDGAFERGLSCFGRSSVC